MDGATHPEDTSKSEHTDDPVDEKGTHHDPGAGRSKRWIDNDINLLMLRGRVVAEPEIRKFETGATLIRYLATVTSPEPRRRLDVIPVSYWDPPENLLRSPGRVRDRICVLGSIQRRFWPQAPGQVSSRIEVVASEVHVRPG